MTMSLYQEREWVKNHKKEGIFMRKKVEDGRYQELKH